MLKIYFNDQLKDPDLREIVDDIHASSIRLIDIVNDFLKMASIEQGKIRFSSEVFDVQKVIETVVNEASVLGKEKGLHISADPNMHNVLPKVVADQNRVKEIIYNLIGNAVKYTEEGSITVSTELADNHVKVVVRDTGRGISSENQKLLFRKFQQASESLLTRDTTRGTGLGLYISKILAEGMNCNLALDHSEQGVGSAFYLLLPTRLDQAVA